MCWTQLYWLAGLYVNTGHNVAERTSPSFHWESAYSKDISIRSISGISQYSSGTDVGIRSKIGTGQISDLSNVNIHSSSISYLSWSESQCRVYLRNIGHEVGIHPGWDTSTSRAHECPHSKGQFRVANPPKTSAYRISWFFFVWSLQPKMLDFSAAFFKLWNSRLSWFVQPWIWWHA